MFYVQRRLYRTHKPINWGAMLLVLSLVVLISWRKVSQPKCWVPPNLHTNISACLLVHRSKDLSCDKLGLGKRNASLGRQREGGILSRHHYLLSCDVLCADVDHYDPWCCKNIVPEG